jgi:CBS domain-containing protein
MTTNVVTVTHDMSVVEAAKLMLDRRISGVPVINDSGQLIGILTEGDLMRRAELMTEGRPWWLVFDSSAERVAKTYVKAYGLRVKDVMTKHVVTLDEHDPLDRIAMMFEERGIKRAPVVRDGRIVGIVSRANLLQGLAAGKIGGVRPSDSEIRSAVMTAAQKEAGIRASLVDVTVSAGVVHLWGDVATEAERDAMRVVAETTEGVRDVQNHIRILPPSVLEWKPE